MLLLLDVLFQSVLFNLGLGRFPYLVYKINGNKVLI